MCDDPIDSAAGEFDGVPSFPSHHRMKQGTSHHRTPRPREVVVRSDSQIVVYVPWLVLHDEMNLLVGFVSSSCSRLLVVSISPRPVPTWLRRRLVVVGVRRLTVVRPL